MSESFHNLSYICLFILGILNLCCKAFKLIFTKDLVFDLDVKHVCSNSNLQVDEVGWSNQTIPCFLLSSSVFFPVLERKFVPRMMLYLTLLLSNASTFCWLMRLFLSNSGSLMPCIMMTSCVLRQPARVLTNLVSPSNFVIMPFGKAYLLIIETLKPESKSTWKSLWLLTVPIVSAVQMVMGDSCSGILILGPW